jgi:predicted GNAT family N-acyltransferase
MKQEIVVTTAETPEQRESAFRLRETVFLGEMRRDRTVETDAYDEDACHIIALSGDDVVGTMRLYRLRLSDTSIKIGRVAVDSDYRHRGIGSKMMEFAHDWASKQGFVDCYLHAQIAVRPFYEALGYVAEGGVFMEAGTEHILMRRKC